MAKRSNYSRLAQISASERNRLAQSNPGILSGLTPTQIAELFPDYFRRGTPDVGGFQAAISKESARKQQLWQGSVDSRLDRQGGMLSRMRQEYGGGGSYTAGKGEIASGQKIVAGLIQRGFSKAEASAIAGNISAESRFNTGVTNSIGAFGLMQWLGPRKQSLMSMAAAQGKDPSDLNLQLDFIKKELKGGGHETDQFNRAVAESGGDVSKMSYLFGKYVERPADWELAQSAARRQGVATQLYSQDISGSGETPQQGKQGATPGQGGTPTTPSAPGADTTRQAGQRSAGGTNFSVVSGYIVPNDKSLYDSRNASQCATLGKAFNPNIGRSSGWTIVDGDIKAGQVVATKQYNNGGADRVGAGYHTGVALTAPNEKGDFLLLEQYNGSGGAKTRWVNKNSYPIGHTGQTTSWGLISSGGKVHDEVSQEALAYGQQIADPSQKSVIGTNSSTPGSGGNVSPGVEGSVEYADGNVGGTTIGPGEQQSASLMQPVAMMQNLMAMTQGMMGGQSATPLGLITSAMGFIVPLVGTIAGERITGEGMGGPASLPNINVAGSSQLKGRGLKKSTYNPVNAPADPKHDYMRRVAIEREAKALGIDPQHLATTMLFESAGSLNPDRKGVVDRRKSAKAAVAKGAQNKFMGLIQFGAAEQLKYGVRPGMSFDEQMRSVGNYLRDKGLTKWLQKNPNATEEEKRIALYSTINAGGPDKKNWHKTDKRYGGSSTTVIQKTAQMFKDFGGRADRLMASSDTGTSKYAEVRPQSTTPGVESQATTPRTGAPITAMAQSEPSIMQRAQSLIGSKSTMAGQSTVTPTTPSQASTATTPTYVAPGTPQVSSSVSAMKEPGVPVSKEARTPFGIYSNPSRSDMMTQFGYRKRLDTASVLPQQSAPLAVTTPNRTLVTSMPQNLPAPGPALDTTSMQMNNQMQTILASQASRPAQTQAAPQQVTQVTQVLNHDHTMKMIQNPVDNPSIHRAFSRAFGNETPGIFGESHFNYGNAK